MFLAIAFAIAALATATAQAPVQVAPPPPPPPSLAALLTPQFRETSGTLFENVVTVLGKSFADAVTLGAKVNALARSTPDFRNAIARFLKKPS